MYRYMGQRFQLRLRKPPLEALAPELIRNNAIARKLAAQWAREYGVEPPRTVKFSKELAKADLGSGKGKAKSRSKGG